MTGWVDHIKNAADRGLFPALALFFLLLPIGTAPPLLALGLAGICWLLSGNLRQLPAIFSQSWFWPVVPVVGLPWLGMAWSQNPELGMDYAMKGKYWAALFITATMAMDENRVLVLAKALWLGLFTGAVLAIAQYLGVAPAVDPRYPGFGVVHTLLTMYLIVGILMAAYYFRYARSTRFKALLVFLILALVLHLALLRGRAGYLIFILVSPMVAGHLMHPFRFRTKAVTALVLAVALFLSPVVRNTIENTGRLFSENKTALLQGREVPHMPRFYILFQTVAVLKSHPIRGIGTGSLREFTGERGNAVTHPHNNFLYMWISFGIPGLLACAWLFWGMFRISWKQRQTPLGYFTFSTCLVLFLGGMFDTQLLNTGTLMMLAIFYGFLNQLSRDT